MSGSAFRASFGSAEDDSRWLTARGGAASTSFGGEADGVALTGDVASFTVGADTAWSRWLAGVAVSHSLGCGGGEGRELGGDVVGDQPRTVRIGGLAPVRLGAGRMLTPTVEFGLRRDGGKPRPAPGWSAEGRWGMRTQRDCGRCATPASWRTVTGSTRGMRLAAELGYDLNAFRGLGTMTPFLGTRSGAGGRDLRQSGTLD